ncbi:MAG: arsenate reductase ArsC [Anaerolineae bacterium]|nr:arsenate reductase ArsC [Anaerolineae bacterium]
MTTKRRVLFLCTGNSARSQMAEGLVNHFLGDRWQAFSAGTAPAGYVHPLAIEAMRELGIDISQHRSKRVDEFREASFDLVITLCSGAADDCPVWLGPGHRLHMGFADPEALARAGSGELAAFRCVRDAIREKVLAALESRDEAQASHE